jgi:Protein of unknown function (DUF1579)
MTQRRAIFAAAVLLAFAAGTAIAQPAAEAPKPSPEQEKLGYFVGKWKSEGEMKPSPFMPGGSFTTTDDCQWFEGGFAVVCHSQGSGPMGATKGLGIMGYSADEGVYTYYGVDNSPMAMASVPRGTIQGDTWTYSDEAKMGGKMIKSRYVMQQLSPTSYTFKWEMQDEAGGWQTVMEGKSTKSM